MQSIDIHSLIDKDFYAATSDTRENVEQIASSIPNTFTPLLGSKYKTFVLSNAEKDEEKLLYFFRFTRKHFYLIQSKNNKLRVNHYDFSKHFLNVNKRKADLDEFKKLRSNIRKLAVLLISHSPYVLLKKKESPKAIKQSDALSSVMDTLQKRISFSDKALQLLSSVSKDVYQRVGKYLTKFSSLLLVKKVRKKSDAKTLDLGCFESIIKQFVPEKYACVVISNYVDKAKNSLYCLEITEEQLELTEKNKMHQNKIFVSLKENAFVINGKDSDEKQYQWVLNKLRRIGSDLNKNKAKMYYT